MRREFKIYFAIVLLIILFLGVLMGLGMAMSEQPAYKEYVSVQVSGCRITLWNHGATILVNNTILNESNLIIACPVEPSILRSVVIVFHNASFNLYNILVDNKSLLLQDEHIYVTPQGVKTSIVKQEYNIDWFTLVLVITICIIAIVLFAGLLALTYEDIGKAPRGIAFVRYALSKITWLDIALSIIFTTLHILLIAVIVAQVTLI
jgi:hypothetical protein